MDVWEVVKVILSSLGGISAAIFAVLAYQYKDKVATIIKAIDQEKIERQLEYSSVRSKMEVLSDEREKGDSKVHERINDIERRLPNEYARQGTVDALERRLDNIQLEMREGFRHQSTLLQEINRRIKNGHE